MRGYPFNEQYAVINIADLSKIKKVKKDKAKKSLNKKSIIWSGKDITEIKKNKALQIDIEYLSYEQAFKRTHTKAWSKPDVAELQAEPKKGDQHESK